MAGRHWACKNVAYLQGRHLHSSLEARTHTQGKRDREREGHTQTHRHARKVKLAHLSYFTFLTHFKRGEPKRHKVTAGAGQERGTREEATPAAPAVDDCILFSCVIPCISYIYKLMYILYRVYYLFLCFLCSLLSLFLWTVFGFVSYFYFFAGPLSRFKTNSRTVAVINIYTHDFF